MKINIHYARYGKKETIYVEDISHDDGVHLIACSILTPDNTGEWSKQVWRDVGIMAEGQRVHKVVKHAFYGQWFGVIELFDADNHLLGYYCDVVTPLRKEDGEYFLQDILLDLWIFPDGRCVELDWDEFEAAVQQGLLPEEHRQKAVETMHWMVNQTQLGLFPGSFLTSREC